MDRAYIALLGVLRRECSREMDRDQDGEPLGRALLKTMEAVIAYRAVMVVEQEMARDLQV